MTRKIEYFDGIELLSGAYMNYHKPEESKATIEDLGHALSNVCRFSGHLPRFYSVAQHLVNTAAVLKEMGCGPSLMYAGLMHDTAEAFTNDLPTPLKAAFPPFKELEVKIETAMAERFSFMYPLPPQVKLADAIMLGLEKEFVKKCDANWACLEGVDYLPYKGVVDLSRMTPDRAYTRFMEAYEDLCPLIL